MNENSRKYTAFVTSNGHYQFLKVPFGLCNSPAVFQRFINAFFRDLSNQGVVCTYDDLVIPAQNKEQADDRLEKVLKVAKDYGLEINKKKCQFALKSIEFLGHRIENGKIFPSENKTKAVMNFPELNSTKQVQSFLGLTGYFRKFIPYYSIIARPSSD